MATSVKAKDQNHTEAELKFLIAKMPKFEEDCNFKGQCQKDMDSIEHLAQSMLISVQKGDWNTTDKTFESMGKVLEEAKKDCAPHRRFGKLRADDQCKKDLNTTHMDVEHLLESVKKEDATACEAELKSLEMTIPDLEKACELKGDCAKDFWMVDGIAKKMDGSIAAKDWKKTDEYTHAMMEVLHKAHTDCHAKPPPP